MCSRMAAGLGGALRSYPAMVISYASAAPALASRPSHDEPDDARARETDPGASSVGRQQPALEALLHAPRLIENRHGLVQRMSQATGRAEREAAQATIDRHDPAPSGASPWRPARPTLSLVAAGRDQQRHGAAQRLRPAGPGAARRASNASRPRVPCTDRRALRQLRWLSSGLWKPGCGDESLSVGRRRRWRPGRVCACAAAGEKLQARTDPTVCESTLKAIRWGAAWS
jgi:hypothetical protein